MLDKAHEIDLSAIAAILTAAKITHMNPNITPEQIASLYNEVLTAVIASQPEKTYDREMVKTARART